jgi:rhodanese-related sulfurtransferase
MSFNQKLAAFGIFCMVITFLSSLFKPSGLHANQNPVFMDVLTLAQRIKNRDKLTIVDIRDPSDYQEFHIPTAINVPLLEFSDAEWNNQSLIIYSGDDNLARKLWYDLPQSLKSKSNIVYGGVHDWYNRVLYPNLPINVNSKDSLLVEQIYLLSLFYGGQPEFQTESHSVEYYKQDFSRVSWPTVERKGTLVRKGC